MGIKRFSTAIASSLIWLLFYACQESSSLSYRREVLRDSLLSFYKDGKDSIQRQAARFLVDNMDQTQTVTFPLFKDKKTKKQVSLNLLEIFGKRQFDSLLKAKNITCYDTTVCDAMLVTSAYLRKQIDKAFSDWRTYPWNKGVSKEMFLNYLLPYKVDIDKPTDWRNLLYNQYYLDLLHLKSPLRKKNSPDDIVGQFPVFKASEYEPLFIYADVITKVSASNNFELLLATRQGDCLDFTLMNVYRLRSLGIPAAMDATPLWGKANSRHSETVYLNGKGIMKPLKRFGDDVRQPTKVLRYTYKTQKIWSDTIEPTVNYPKDFQLKNLMNNHWVDVTALYNQVADVTYTLNKAYPEKYAYICVLNYGQWMPVFWGAKTGNKVVFKKMGTDMIYRVAVPIGNDIKFVSAPFLLSRNKELNFHQDDGRKYDSIKLYKVNTGKESILRVGETYILSYWHSSGYWAPLETIKAAKMTLDLNDWQVKEDMKVFYTNNPDKGIDQFKSYLSYRGVVVYKNAPKNAFYKLEAIHDPKHYARIFIIDSISHKQVWY